MTSCASDGEVGGGGSSDLTSTLHDARAAVNRPGIRARRICTRYGFTGSDGAVWPVHRVRLRTLKETNPTTQCLATHEYEIPKAARASPTLENRSFCCAYVTAVAGTTIRRTAKPLTRRANGGENHEMCDGVRLERLSSLSIATDCDLAAPADGPQYQDATPHDVSLTDRGEVCAVS
jgi:hypothetical protein